MIELDDSVDIFVDEEMEIDTEPKVEPEVEQGPHQELRPLVVKQDGWKNILIVGLIGLVLYAYVPLGSIPTPFPPNPTPDISVDNVSILFALDGNKGLTVEQAQVASSQEIQQWCDKNGVDYRKYHGDEDLSKEGEQWQKMMKAAKEAGLPSVVIIDEKNIGKIVDVHSSVDDALEMLKGIKK